VPLLITTLTYIVFQSQRVACSEERGDLQEVPVLLSVRLDRAFAHHHPHLNRVPEATSCMS
jgi:hypothetical protein